MNIKATIAIVNQLQAEGLIGTYAVGGAVAAAFYIEAAATIDVDVFIGLAPSSGSTLVTLTPIYDYLKARGCREEGEYIVVAGWPVQFLLPSSPLVDEALLHAVAKDSDGLKVRVFTAEYLAAIALELGRPKDKYRLTQFLEANVLNEPIFSSILERHKLTDKWTRFKRQMSGES